MDDTGIATDVAKVAAGSFSAGGGFFALRWIVGVITRWSERRAARLDAQEERADREWQQIREEIKQQLADALKRVGTVERQNLALRRAFNHVAGALLRIEPKHTALAEADHLLAASFPVDFDLAMARAEAALDQAQSAPATGDER
ncbi:hypothetical protein [Sphingobium sp. Z007]|uniref:hypothetical protein n=1 Tax=Sphingobium sp. Z007 TaxID=627495 RepID=UPI000B49CBF3|nr:hypothetical protein [Sphingobium sp. Z007]